MAKMVSSIKLDEVSLVDQGANPGAHIVLMKREEAPELREFVTKEAKTFDEIMERKETTEMLWNAICSLEQSIQSIMHDDEIKDKKSMVGNAALQFKGKITKLKKGAPMPAELKKLQDEFDALKKAHDDVLKLNTGLVAEVDQLKKVKEDDKEGDINKNDMPEPLKKKFEDMEKKEKANSELIAKLLDDKAEAVYLEKAAGYKNLPAKVEDLGKLLKRMSTSLIEEDLDGLLSILSAADEAIGKGDLFKEIGSGNNGSSAGSALAMMKAEAESLRKVDPSLSQEKAFTRAMELNPTLYNEYLMEKK